MFCHFPVQIPVTRDLSAETGSLETAWRTRQSSVSHTFFGFTHHPLGTPQYCALPVAIEQQLQLRDRQNQNVDAQKRAWSLVPGFQTAVEVSGLIKPERYSLALPVEREVCCKKCARIK